MYNEKDILARLQNGENAQAIADEMAKMLNSAIDQKAKADAEAAALAAKNKENEAKAIDLTEILNDFHLWLDTYYPSDDWEHVFDEIDAGDIIELIDSLQELGQALEGLGVAKTPVAKKVAVKCPNSGAKANPDATIEAFLKNMGW